MDDEKFSDKFQDMSNQQITSRSFQNPPSESSTKAVPSCSSVKSKKSSNILSAFVKRTRKSKTHQKYPNTITIPAKDMTFIPSNSSVGLRSEEVELIVENYERKLETIGAKHNKESSTIYSKFASATDSEHSLRSGMKIKHQFFRKFIRRHTSNECGKKNVRVTQPEDKNESQTFENSWDSSEKGDHMSVDEITPGIVESNVTGIQSSYLNSTQQPLLTITLVNGLHAVHELSHRLQDNDNYLIEIFKKYIFDTNFQKELVELVSQHSKLHSEAEKKNHALANDMWMYQMETGRKQERILQETLNSLVRQNRQLQIDHEVLFRKYEKLLRKTQLFQEFGMKHKCTKEYEQQIDMIITHNENLQCKMESLIRRIDTLENETYRLKKRNENLDEQLGNSSSQVQNLKVLLHRSKTNYELDVATLNQTLQKNAHSLKEAFEARDDLVNELDDLRKRVKAIPLCIDWSKLKTRENGLADTIHFCRSCINEMAETIFSLHSQLGSRDEDIDILRETNCKLQENLKKSTTELDDLSKKMEVTTVREANKIVFEQKCDTLENDLKIIQEKMERMKLEHDLEKNSLLSTIARYEHLNNEILEKNNMIEQTKMFITNISSENMALRSQVEGLNKILTETGAGDVVRELTNNQEQLIYYQSQYYQVLNEKQRLLDQLEVLRVDNKNMMENQEINHKQWQNQVLELENVSKENKTLRQQVEKNHQTVISLQNERKKYLEEKDLLKAIFHHLKSEISRVQKLECTVSDISKEANKLAMIAEYNKQLGKKLKSEIIEKDKTILLLKTSVEKLNDIQMRDTKEKLSLCYELSEVCHMKDHLNNILSMEVQKNMELDDSKKEVVQTASNQIKKYEDFQKKERSVLKDLLKDLKIVVKQRDALEREREDLLRELGDLRISQSEQNKKIEDLVSGINTTQSKLDSVQAKYEEEKDKVEKLQDNLSRQVGSYNENVKQLEKLIIQLRKEKSDAENSIQYLQNNVQKLHNDLNEARRNEKESKDMFNSCLIEKTELVDKKVEQQRKIEILSDEKEKLTREVNHVNSLCEKILSDFEANIKSAMEKEELYKKEHDETKHMILKNTHEIEQLSSVLATKQEELHNVANECDHLKQKEKQHIKLLENQKMNSEELKRRNEKLENELIDLHSEYENMKLQLNSTNQELDSLYKQMKIMMEQKEDEYRFYKKHMEETLRKNEDIRERDNSELKELKLHLNDLTQKLENERSAYASLSQIHKDVSAKFIKGIKDIVDEKSARQEAVAKLKDITDTLERLRTEKADLQQQVNILLDGLNDGKNRINTLTQERDNCQNSLDELQKKYNEMLKKCLSLENQVRGVDLNKDAESENLKDQIDTLKRETEDNHTLISSLKQDLAQLKLQLTGLEFQKSELTLRLHEMQRKFETETNLCQQLKNIHKLILAAVLEMKDDGNINDQHCNRLLQLVKCNSATDHSDTDEIK